MVAVPGQVSMSFCSRMPTSRSTHPSPSRSVFLVTTAQQVMVSPG